MKSANSLAFACLSVAFFLVAACGTGSVTPPGDGGFDDGDAGISSCMAADPTVNTRFGPVCGVPGKGGYPDGDQKPVWSYKGIPYAAATGGENRWIEAKDPAAWTSPRPAKVFGPICVQLGSLTTIKGSDDCLSVNVYTPVPPSGGQSLPVMVFIHGGAFMEGTGGNILYDGSGLAGGGNVVVVTLNYRLGVLGFLGGFGTGDAKDGNFGLKDQQKALKWVKQNIAAFGGDPSNVTLFGESAGASSTGVHLVNEQSKAYFRRAIMESNHYGMLYQNRNTANTRAHKLAEDMGCKKNTEGKALTEDEKLACLRLAADRDLQALVVKAGPTPVSAGVSLLCNAFGGFEYWAPMMDGAFVKNQPVDTVIDKPVMMGTNHDEGVYFVSLVGLYPTLPDHIPLDVLMTALFGARGTEVVLAYGGYSAAHKNGETAGKILTDYIFHCANNHVLNAASKAGNSSIYGYHFTHLPTVSVYSFTEKQTGGYWCSPGVETVCHANELPYAFGNPIGYASPGQNMPLWEGFRDSEKPMTGAMMRFWTGFAVNGAPDQTGGFPKFAHSTLPEGVYEQIATETEGGIIQVTGLYKDAQCSFWDAGIDPIGWKKDWMQTLCSDWPF